MAATAFALLAVAAVGTSGLQLSTLQALLPGSGCDIKGNIARTGERIYHMPGQDYYSRTRVSWLRGERWFCSEAEARQAGWRRSRV